MDEIFDVLLFGLIEAEYLLGLDDAPNADAPNADALGANTSRVIEREVRRSGGNALRCARALAHWGARVCLMGNSLADDSNGRLIHRELDDVPNLTMLAMVPAAPLPAGYETPYSVACLARPSSRLVLTRHQHARHFDSMHFAQTRETTETTEANAVPARLVLNVPDGSNHSGAPRMSTRPWPQSRLAAICGDRLPHAARDLARAMNERHIPLWTFDAVAEAKLEVALWSAPQAVEAEKWLLRQRDDVTRVSKTMVVVGRDEQKIWWQHQGEEPQNMTLGQATNALVTNAFGNTMNSIDDLLARDGSESIFLAGLLWARLQNWEWRRALRFATSAWTLALPSPHATPSLGQIEAVS